MDHDTRERLINQYLVAIRNLEADEAVDASGQATSHWPPRGYYLLFHVVVGTALGMIGATVSLMVNVAGSLLVGKHPLELIRVYLTFPMGESALATEDGKALFVGCVLYLITGGIYGVAFHLAMSWYFPGASLKKRFIVANIMGLGLWIVNFYLILSWLQPVLLGGNWILTEVPFYVAAFTHLVFAWTLWIVEYWGRFEPPPPASAGLPTADSPAAQSTDDQGAAVAEDVKEAEQGE